MKKFFSFLLASILVVSLISCSGDTKNESDTSTNAPAVSDSVADSAESKLDNILEFTPEQGGAGGMGFIGDKEILRYNLINSNDGLDSSYPVFRDAYPVSTVGPAYDPTDEELARSEAELRDFLTSLFGDEIASDIEIKLKEKESYEVTEYKMKVAEYENIKIFYDVSGYICIYLADTIIDEELIKTSPTDNDYIKAALDYAGIDNPLVVAGDQTLIDYDIYDKDSLESSERKFDFLPHVKVAVFSSSSSAICIYNAENIFELEPTNYPTVPYTDALEYVKATYPDADLSTLICRARYDNEACLGYYVPIYEFIFKDTAKSNSDSYHDIKISAVEFTPDVVLH